MSVLLQTAQWVVAAVIMIGVLVVIHEFGHFVLARLFRIGTPVFSIGMGPRVWGFRAWETDFRISALPIGGYVRMAGADPFGEEDLEDECPKDQSFMEKPVWQRLIVMAAGPAMNLVLPLGLFTVAFMAGRPAPTSEVGMLLPQSAAAEAGLQVGDRITAVNGDPTSLMDEVRRELRDRVGEPVTLTVDRDGSTVTVQLPAEGVLIGLDGQTDLASTGFQNERRRPLVAVVDPQSPAGRAGLRTFDFIAKVDGAPVASWEELEAALTPGVPHTLERVRMTPKEVPAGLFGWSTRTDYVEERAPVQITPDPAWTRPAWATYADGWGLEYPATYVGRVEKDSPAAKAGLSIGDRIVSLDHRPVEVWRDVLVGVAGTIEGSSIRPLTLEVVRDHALVKVTLEPRLTTETRGAEVVKRPIMGVTQTDGLITYGEFTTKYYAFGEAMAAAVDMTAENVRGIVKMLGNIFSGRIFFTEVLGGPVSIVYQAGAAAEGGLYVYVMTMGFLSLSLGVINLLPFPLLDGGQIVFYVIEWVRGRPVPAAMRERIQMVGALALAALLVVVTIKDVGRWLTG